MEWWRKSVVYQIYPKSFNDTTGSGVGDIEGIIQKLDYIKTLGVDVIWLTPIYDSPQRDNGYDIRDYYKIHEEYGTMEDFERLISESHQRGIKVIMDIVVNHTSTEHRWFKEALNDPNSEFRDFYIWKEGKDGEPPTNWKSKFGGSAWQYDGKSGEYYLHLYDVTQADLNWENEKLRNNIYEMMTYWFNKGVDGFRLDVVNLLSKNQQFPDDDYSVPPGDGRKFYTDGPRIHEFIHGMNENVFLKFNVMTVGEMSSTTVDHCIKYTNPDRGELDMTFNFHHLKVDYPNGEKWTKADFDFIKLKQILSDWQVKMHEGNGWNALFWCNHDQPRIVSRFGDEGKYHSESAKMLATTIHMMQGTPYIYQGEEFGMTNPNFDQLSSYRDVESVNAFKDLKKQGMSEEEIIDILKQKSRDNSRTPMQWTDSEHAGFTTGEPWIDVANNFDEVNAVKAVMEPDSIFHHYQRLIDLRKSHDVITTGDYQLLLEDDPKVFAYVRNGEDEKLLVVNNFYADEVSFQLPDTVQVSGYGSEILLSNYGDSTKDFQSIQLRPYESIVYHLKKK
ncbi:alpha,alpha-phosphotrehalase [Alkalihalobacillus sp. AL-G]|uniref:alpha,alpha-phosphotrehalase n=1 Tax=Alkalihalobacillus sp. AL-G TaxID=2926399 RepID=UPI00272BAB63|nr:alpha,alpha-phosphotrehalase [Alkalihalobacillus sp. AL-G]WLD95390.1 alpha,alpha-phosphotrehalase [Alkalihalobacillus sp. AL-G]